MTDHVHPEYQYLALLEDLLKQPLRLDRTGVGTRALFGRQFRFDLADGFPLLTTKKLPFRVIALELLWMLSGSTNVRDLQKDGVTIWDEWADAESELGPVYGAQWRRWADTAQPNITYGEGPGEGPDDEEPEPMILTFTPLIDQIDKVLKSLRDNPMDRGHIVSAWNVADLPRMKLRPCHCLFQFFVESDGRLSLQLYQRSADIFLGVPFNIASYALLLTMFAKVLGREPGEFVHTFGDVHLYANHEDQAREQLTREPRAFPRLTVAQREDMDSWTLGDFTLFGYQSHPHIPAPVAV